VRKDPHRFRTAIGMVDRAHTVLRAPKLKAVSILLGVAGVALLLIADWPKRPAVSPDLINRAYSCGMVDGAEKFYEGLHEPNAITPLVLQSFEMMRSKCTEVYRYVDPEKRPK